MGDPPSEVGGVHETVTLECPNAPAAVAGAPGRVARQPPTITHPVGSVGEPVMPHPVAPVRVVPLRSAPVRSALANDESDRSTEAGKIPPLRSFPEKSVPW